MNIYTIAGSLNVVDCLMAIVTVSVIVLGRKDGIVSGLFKLFGILVTVFVTLHTYVHLAGFLQKNFLGKDAVTEIFSYSLVTLSIFAGFICIAKSSDLILKIKSFGVVDRWGNMVLSLLRSCFICSLIFLGLLLSGSGYVTAQAKKSVSWHLFRTPAVEFYRITYKTLVAKIFPGVKINRKILNLIEDVPLKSDDK